MKTEINPKIKKVQGEHYFWLDIEEPEKKEAEFLKETFGFHPLDIEEVVNDNQRSKTDVYQKYAFIVLLFPTYLRGSKEIRASEVDIFIGHDFLITCHKKNMTVFKKIYDLCQVDKKVKDKAMGLGPEKMLFELLEKLYLYCFPMLDHVNIDISEIEEGMFSGQEKRTTQDLLVARRNITDYRRIIQPHKKVLQKLTDKNNKNKNLFQAKNGEVDLENMVDHVKEIWDLLESFKESVDTFQHTNDSLISHKLNNIMKTLTAISVIVLPMSIIVNLWSMNTGGPLYNHPFGFWIVLGIMLLSSTMITIYFKTKKWL